MMVILVSCSIPGKALILRHHLKELRPWRVMETSLGWNKKEVIMKENNNKDFDWKGLATAVIIAVGTAVGKAVTDYLTDDKN